MIISHSTGRRCVNRISDMGTMLRLFVAIAVFVGARFVNMAK